jgi:hypothetical protein
MEELDVYCHFVKHGDDESLLYLEGQLRRTAEQEALTPQRPLNPRRATFLQQAEPRLASLPGWNS